MKILSVCQDLHQDFNCGNSVISGSYLQITNLNLITIYQNRFNYESMNGHIEKGISNAFTKLKIVRDDRKIDDVNDVTLM